MPSFLPRNFLTHFGHRLMGYHFFLPTYVNWPRKIRFISRRTASNASSTLTGPRLFFIAHSSISARREPRDFPANLRAAFSPAPLATYRRQGLR